VLCGAPGAVPRCFAWVVHPEGRVVDEGAVRVAPWGGRCALPQAAVWHKRRVAHTRLFRYAGLAARLPRNGKSVLNALHDVITS
jgi:hypothetical protein